MAAKNNPSYYHRFPVTQQLQHTEHVFHLYVEQRSEHLPNGNQITIRSAEPVPLPPTVPPSKPPQDPAGHFGYGISCDWDVRDGPSPTAKIVARAQGLLLGTGQTTMFQYFLCQNILFTDERFKGSSLKLLGSLPSDLDDELAIIGGTGEFSFAQGSVKYKEVKNDPTGIVVRELNIRVLCTHIRSPYKDGPLGGKGGKAFDIPEALQRLESVTIRSGDVIDSLAFSYTDQAGKKQIDGPWGSNGGLPDKMSISLGATENVTKVTGTIGEFEGDTIVTSLTFFTNAGTTYGPFGKANGTQFSIPKNNGDTVVGFFGRAGLFLNALGVYAIPSVAN